MPAGLTMPGVPSRVRPTKPTGTPSTNLMSIGGRIGRPVFLLIVFAARYLKSAPRNRSPSWQPSVGWQPPRCMRSSSSTPSSNSWLPTELICSPISFISSIVGSSWNAALTSGDAPIRSPAPTVSVLRPSASASARSFFSQVARYSTPPAGVPLTAAPLPAGGSIAPWKSL